MQKFWDGLNPDLRHDVRGFKLNTLGALVNKVKALEESRNEMKSEKGFQKNNFGKRSFGTFAGSS